MTVGGSGAQTAEVGLFYSSYEPCRNSPTLGKLWATGSVDDLTTTGRKKNTSSPAAWVAAGTMLFAGIRTAMAGAQPTIVGLGLDMEYGNLAALTTAGALTDAGPYWTGTPPAASAAAVSPLLRAVLD